MSKIKDTDYLTISARIRARETRLLTRERMERMLDARSGEESAKVLAECGYPELSALTGRGLDELLSRARADLYRAFAALLARETGLEPVLWDERRTTVEAHAILHGTGKKMKDHRKNVDAVAASLILEGYLTFRKR